MRFRVTPVVLNLIIINFLVYFGKMVLLQNNPSALNLYFPASDNFSPYQLVTHMFDHSKDDFTHIFFNMLLLFFFAPRLEALWGPKKFLFYYFACGFGAMLLQLIVWSIEIYILGGGSVNYHMLGASGAVMGIMMGFGMKFHNERIMLIIPPIPIRAIYLVLFLISMDILGVFGKTGEGVAHFAHLGGALTGFLLMEYWGRFKSKW